MGKGVLLMILSVVETGVLFYLWIKRFKHNMSNNFDADCHSIL